MIARPRCDGIEIAIGQNERRCLKPGAGRTEQFKDCPTCPEMVVVPEGTFMMGSPQDEPQRYNDEGQVQVSIATPFAVGKYAVSFDEWDACSTEGGCNGYKPDDEGWGRGNRPAINVNWNDTMAYVAWLPRKTGKGYRLLSEAEREYVTRAGATTPFWWSHARPRTGPRWCRWRAGCRAQSRLGFGFCGSQPELTPNFIVADRTRLTTWPKCGETRAWDRPFFHKDRVKNPSSPARASGGSPIVARNHKLICASGLITTTASDRRCVVEV